MNTPRFLDVQIEHPRKTVVPLAVGLGWGNDGAIYQEKLDGKFHHHRDTETQSALVGEWMPARGMAEAGFIAWDIVEYRGADVRGMPLTTRLWMRDEICRINCIQAVATWWNGGRLLETVLARGGEGIVRKLPGATYFEAMIACKRLQTWVCRVVALDHATGGAAIADAGTGEKRGTVPLRNRAGQCRVGSIVKVEGLELTAAGKIRDPRPCKDTPSSWLIRF